MNWGNKMNDRNWGGKREGAGKKPLVRNSDEIPKLRGIKYNDIEWNKIKKWASLMGMSAKGFLYFAKEVCYDFIVIYRDNYNIDTGLCLVLRGGRLHRNDIVFCHTPSVQRLN